MVKYKLFENKVGAITGRTPALFKDFVPFCFEGAPDNSTAILKDKSGNTIYRDLTAESTCSFPISFFEGEISVTLKDLKRSFEVLWNCEAIKCEKNGNGVWIMPAEINLPLKIFQIYHEMDKLKKELENQKQEIASLKEAYQGYDVI